MKIVHKEDRFFMNTTIIAFLTDKIEEIAFSTVEAGDALWTSRILDSITIVELVVEIELEYGITIPFNEIIEDNFETIDNMVKYISAKK
jgi:acyl carrier protein